MIVSEAITRYDEFTEKLHEKYPKIFAGKYGGLCIDEGWWPIIEALASNIQQHIDWNNEGRERLLKGNPNGWPVPEYCEQVVVQQIKEKFGGLRFYYVGGDARIRGMVQMAEAWADRACEVCGAPGIPRTGGWIKTLCDTHEAEREAGRKGA